MSNIHKARQRNTRWDGVIRACLARPYETPHRLGPVDDEATAWEAASGIYAARRHFNVAAKTWAEPDDQGQWWVNVILYDPAKAKRYIAAKVQRGEPLLYNVLRPKPKTKGK